MNIEEFNAAWKPLWLRLFSPLTDPTSRVQAAVDGLMLIEKSVNSGLLGPEAGLLTQAINLCLLREGWPDWRLHFDDACSIVGPELAVQLQREYERLLGDGTVGDNNLIQK